MPVVYHVDSILNNVKTKKTSRYGQAGFMTCIKSENQD